MLGVSDFDPEAVHPAADRTTAARAAHDNDRILDIFANTPRSGRIWLSWLSIIRRQPASCERGREIL
jgi:hypothetical protein